MLYLTKDQIQAIVQKIGQPQATITIKKFYHSYQKKLHSNDLMDIYDNVEYYSTMNRLVPKFETKHSILLTELDKPAYFYLADKITPNDKILDIGCGTGDFVMAMGAHGVKKSVGIDFASKAIEEANIKINKMKLSNSECSCKDVSEFSSDEKFDYVVLNDVTEHLSDSELRVLFEKTKKVLAENGEFLIHTPNGIALCFDAEKSILQEIRKLLLRILKGWKGFEWTVEQLYYHQVHINVKSFKSLSKLLNKCGYRSFVIYDEPHSVKPLSYMFSSSMLVVAKNK